MNERDLVTIDPDILEPELLEPELLEPETTNEEQPRRRATRRRLLPNAKGMTLVEIMIVLTILAGIMVAVGVYAFDALDRAKIKETRLRLNKISNSIQEYYAFQEPNSLPGDLNDLVDPPSGENGYLKAVDLKDSWGNEITYNKNSERSFELRSPGADGSDGTDDDISVEE